MPFTHHHIIRNIHKFQFNLAKSIYLKRNVLPVSSHIHLSLISHNHYSSLSSITPYNIHRRLINTPTQKTPDPHHRVYRRAQIPKETNRWMEKVILALCVGICLFPLSFMYNYYDGTVPITNRKRFLIIPFWLDNLVGTYTLAALGIGSEDEEDDTQTSEQDTESPYNIQGSVNTG
eukprot:869364_1